MREVGPTIIQVVRPRTPGCMYQKDRIFFKIGRNPRSDSLPGYLFSLLQTHFFEIDDVKFAEYFLDRELADMGTRIVEVERRIEVGTGVSTEGNAVDAVAIPLVCGVRGG